MRIALAFLLTLMATPGHARDLPLKSIAHISAQHWSVDYAYPWRLEHAGTSEGSGVYIGDGLILTNAHVVQNPLSITVAAANTDLRIPAELLHISEESDLAMLSVDPDAIQELMEPIRLGKSVQPGDTVTTLGFPGGGTDPAATQGIVSRLTLSDYSHTGRSLPVIQVDAAINGGASGGALLSNGRLSGLLFQMAPDLENVGHAIPLSVIRQFLEDIKDDQVDGLPSLGIYATNMINPEKRRKAGFSEKGGGLEVMEVSKFVRAQDVQAGDIIIGFNRSALTPEGNLTSNPSLSPGIAAALMQMGDSVGLRIQRDNELIVRNLQLSHTWSDHYLVPVPMNDRAPHWINFGGVILTELNDGYFSGDGEVDAHLSRMSGEYQKGDSECPESLVFISNVLPHETNRGYENWLEEQIVTVNGAKVQNFDHLNYMIFEASGAWIELTTAPNGARILFSRDGLKQAISDTQTQWGLDAWSNPPAPSSLKGICH